MKKILFIIFTLILITGCGKEETKKLTYDSIIEENNYVVVDVRTKEEYDEGHVKGSLNIPYDQINSSTKLDKDKTIMVYCRSGNRSGIAYKTLTDLGYTVYDLGAYESITLDKE